MSCFAADIPLVVQTNWYYQLYLGTLDSGPSPVSGTTEYEMLFQGDYSDWTTYKTC
jgi:hypothetical protein